jgi:hypothetical protein
MEVCHLSDSRHFLKRVIWGVLRLESKGERGEMEKELGTNWDLIGARKALLEHSCVNFVLTHETL